MIDSLELEPTEKCGMLFKQEFRPTRRGPVGREFMPGNHDPYLKNIYAPLASRFGVEIEKMRIGILRGRSAPLRIPPPKRGTRSGPHPHFTSIPFPRHPEALMVSSIRREDVWGEKKNKK